MTLTIGRASFACGPHGIRQAGDRLSFALNLDGQTTGGDVEVAKVRRQQLLGLDSNADERVIPLTWTGDPDLDGFYRVAGVAVDPFDTYLDRGLMACRVDLERVAGGFAFPRIEVVTGTLERDTSVHTSQEGFPISLAVPAPDNQFPIFDRGDGLVDAGSAGWRQVDAGVVIDGYTWNTVRVWEYPTADNGAIISSFSMWLPPAAYYAGGCVVEVEIDGSWFPVVGRQISIHRKWRISNGMIRLTSADGATPGTLEAWNGSAWVSRNVRHWAGISPGTGIGGYEFDVDRQSPLQILRNSPEMVVVQCRVAQQLNRTYGIRRGDRMIWATHDQDEGIGFDSTDYTAITEHASGGGAYTDVDGTDGMAVVFASELEYTLDLDDGALMTDGVGGFPPARYGFGMTDQDVTTLDTRTRLVSQYFGIAPLQQQVVAR